MEELNALFSRTITSWNAHCKIAMRDDLILLMERATKGNITHFTIKCGEDILFQHSYYLRDMTDEEGAAIALKSLWVSIAHMGFSARLEKIKPGILNSPIDKP